MVPKYGGNENTRKITVLKTFFYLNSLVNCYIIKVSRKMHKHLVPYLLYTSTHKHYFKTYRIKKMNATEMTALHNKATITMGDAAMLLLLHRSLSDIVTFCAIEKMREPTTAEKRHRERSHCNRKERIQAKTISQIEKHVSVCASRYTRPRKLTAHIPRCSSTV